MAFPPTATPLGSPAPGRARFLFLALLAASGCSGSAAHGDSRDQPPRATPRQQVARRIAALRPLAILGHRGTGPTAPGSCCPENSLSAFAAAMREGADGVAIEVHLSGDGRLLVHHGGNLESTSSCRGCIGRRGFDETHRCQLLAADGKPTAETVPALADLFAALPAPALVDIELEISSDCGQESDAAPLARAAVAEVARLQVADRVIFSSFSPAAVRAVKEIDPELYAGLLRDLADDPREALAIARAQRLDAVHPRHGIAAAAVADLRQSGLQVNVWAVNDAGSLRAALASGVTAVISDQPGRLRAAAGSGSGSGATPVSPGG